MIDEKDKKILEVLEGNARLNTKQISRKTGIPITTVFNRIKKLEKSGVIAGYKAIIDKKKLGKNILAYILIDINFDALSKKLMNEEDLAKKILLSSGVESIDIISGETDIIMKVGARDVDELNDFVTKKLRSFEEVGRVKTLIILKGFP